jgi:hypothetical protein
VLEQVAPVLFELRLNRLLCQADICPRSFYVQYWV